MTEEPKFVISSSVQSRVLDDELLLLDTKRNVYYGLNREGAAVWHAIESGFCFHEILRDVGAEWPLPLEERHEVIRQLVAELEGAELVTRA